MTVGMSLNDGQERGRRSLPPRVGSRRVKDATGAAEQRAGEPILSITDAEEARSLRWIP